MKKIFVVLIVLTVGIVMAKGGGCENKIQFRMFNPTESKETVADWIVEVVLRFPVSRFFVLPVGDCPFFCLYMLSIMLIL